MPNSLQFVTKSIPGYVPTDGRCLPCSGFPGKAMCMSQFSSPCDYKTISDNRLSLKCASRCTSSICNATPNNYRRSPNFSRQNKQGFSRNRNDRENKESDSYEDFEESDSFSNKNGSILSFSGNQKFQATSTPGPIEKEIVGLFRKVQSQLRERATKKEDTKVEDSQGKSKENETVDSLLKLLRKHSVQQGKENASSVNNRQFVLDESDRVDTFTKERRSNVPDSINSVKAEIKEIPSPYVSRPKSNFQKRSPVPENKFQPVNSVPQRKEIKLEPESDAVESNSEFLLPEEEVFHELLEDEISEVDEDEHDVAEEQNRAEVIDLSGMKLTELRALAKSRGMKGFSKLKRNKLLDLLSGSGI